MLDLIYRVLAVAALASVVASIVKYLPLPQQVPEWLRPTHGFVSGLKEAFGQHAELVVLFALVAVALALAWRRTAA